MPVGHLFPSHCLGECVVKGEWTRCRWVDGRTLKRLGIRVMETGGTHACDLQSPTEFLVHFATVRKGWKLGLPGDAKEMRGGLRHQLGPGRNPLYEIDYSRVAWKNPWKGKPVLPNPMQASYPDGGRNQVVISTASSCLALTSLVEVQHDSDFHVATFLARRRSTERNRPGKDARNPKPSETRNRCCCTRFAYRSASGFWIASSIFFANPTASMHPDPCRVETPYAAISSSSHGFT